MSGKGTAGEFAMTVMPHGSNIIGVVPALRRTHNHRQMLSRDGVN